MSKNIYRTFAREKKNEEELEELLKAQQPTQPETPDEEEVEVSPEETTFKKRYSDLRSHSQKRENALNDRIANLEKLLEESTKKQLKFPKTKEEVEQWMTKFPDVAAIVRSIAMEEAQKAREDVDRRLKSLNEKEKQQTMRMAYQRLVELHPDFEEIRESEKFQEWIRKQPHMIYAALYENSTDAEAAARAVDLYKADMKIRTKKNDDTPGPARQVKVPPAEAPEAPREVKFTESMVKRMSQRDFEKNIDAINEAMQHKEFYDISGAAR